MSIKPVDWITPSFISEPKPMETEQPEDPDELEQAELPEPRSVLKKTDQGDVIPVSVEDADFAVDSRRRLKRKDIAFTISDEEYTKILASLVPDEIIYHVKKTTYRKYDVCLLFGDASGFTDLTERYSKAGKGGPSRLTVVLNSFIGNMVQEVISAGGDLLKFSGDAYLAWFKVCESMPELPDCIATAIHTALSIQKNHGKYETDVQVTLRVKLAISAGTVAFSSIGTADMKYYIVVGSPVWDIKQAEYMCVAGDVMVAPKTWKMVNAAEYDYEVLSDGQHVKILSSGAGWRAGAEMFDDEMQDEEDDWDMIDTHGAATLSLEEPMGDGFNEQRLSSKDYDRREDATSTMLRPAIQYAVKKKFKSELIPYAIRPVLKGLELNEPIEYLTEMRQVVIVFINVVTAIPSLGKLIRLVDDCYRIVGSSVHAYQGCVNKVSLFDKDCMFLVIFGLRGFKHDLESQIALRCAAEVHEKLTAVDLVRNVSVGVTTGMTYCGVVGHTVRREFTVIGPAVNKAARIMVAYPGKVTCDRETFLHSRLDSGNFILQEQKALKGLQQAGPFYEFREYLMPKKAHILSKFPLLSRDDEMGLFFALGQRGRERFMRVQRKRAGKKGWLDNQGDNTAWNVLMSSSHTDRWVYSRLSFVSGIVIKAEPRLGKSRLLDEMIFSFGQRFENVNVAYVGLTPKDVQVPLLGLHQILSPVFNIAENLSFREKEERILSLVRNVHRVYWKYLYALNDLFHMNIDFSRHFPAKKYRNPTVAMKRIVWVLLTLVMTSYWIIGVDDLEFLDQESWAILPMVLERDYCFLVLAVGQRLEIPPQGHKFLRNKHLFVLTLQPIDKWYQAALACQILDVWAIPPELERVIHERSGGNPGWIESYLVSQLQQDSLHVESIPQTRADEMGLVRPPARMITRAAARKVRTKEQKERDVVRLHPTEDHWHMYRLCFKDSKEQKSKRIGEDEDMMQLFMRNMQTRFRLNYEEEDEPSNADKVIAVCLLGKNVRLLDAQDDEFSTSSLLLRVFDALNTYEQMLLKAASVLGELFSRRMLIALLSEPPPREMCLTIMKLFDIGVLRCDSVSDADVFSHPRNLSVLSALSVIPTRGPRGPQRQMCGCRYNPVDEACNDLPKYASCAQMRFRDPSFRDITYSLLTDTQKKEFHARAIRFLEQETRRCSNCGKLRFNKLLGVTYTENSYRRVRRQQERERKREEHVKEKRDRERVQMQQQQLQQQQQTQLKVRRSDIIGQRRDSDASGSSNQESSTFSPSIAHSSSEISTPHSFSRSTSISMEASQGAEDAMSFLKLITYEDMLLAKLQTTWGDPDDVPGGPIKAKEERHLPSKSAFEMNRGHGAGRVPSAAGLSLTRSFSSVNFQQCQCNIILASVYAQLLGHCRGAELDEKTMDALLELAELSIRLQNHSLAVKLLIEARQLLAEAKSEPQFGLKRVEDTRQGSYIPRWKRPYLMGRIHMLMGNSRIEMHLHEEALYHFLIALHHMGTPFPDNPMIVSMMRRLYRTKLAMIHTTGAGMGTKEGFNATYADQTAETLSLLYKCFRDSGFFTEASLSSMWALTTALQSGYNFSVITGAFCNILESLSHSAKFDTCAKVEVAAMEVCRNRTSYMEAHELGAVAALYLVVFRSLCHRAQVEAAISVGYKTLRIATSARAVKQCLDVLPSLIMMLIARLRIPEAVTLLSDLQLRSIDDSDLTSITWFYALCLDVHLKTGYSVLTYIDCETFFQRQGEAVITPRDPEAAYRFYATMYQWCCRLGLWAEAEEWNERARPEFTRPSLSAHTYIFRSYVGVLESELLYIATLMERNNLVLAEQHIRTCEEAFAIVMKKLKFMKMLQPAYLILLAYFTYLKSKTSKRKKRKALRLLRQASDIASRQGNSCLADSAKHNEKNWRGLLTSVKTDAWRMHAEPDQLIDWRESNKAPPRFNYYTYPLPDCVY